MSQDPNKLIPELQLWNNGEGIDLDGWLSCMGTYELGIAFVHFLWPQFQEHDGCLFRGRVDDANYQTWISSTNGDKTAVEKVMNHLHIVDIFPNVKDSPSREQALYFGRCLKEMWSAKLRTDYPDKDVTVQFFEEDCEDLRDYQITFYQIR